LSKERTYIVRGLFEGNFKMEEIQSENTTSELNIPKNAMRIYRGLITHSEELQEQDFEEPSGEYSFNNLGNIQINTSDQWPINNDRIYHIHTMQLLDPEISDTYTINNASYGVIRGKVIGRVQPRSTLDLTHLSNQDTNPQEPKITDNPTPITQPLPPPPVIGNSGNSGCLPSWQIPSKWLRWLWIILAILFLLLLLDRCTKVGQKLICKYEEGEYREDWEERRAQNDSLQTRIDSLNLDEEGHFVDADYLIITYYFDESSGLDLDTRTQLINPETSRILGFGYCTDNNFERSGQLNWAGDNQGFGAESCMIDLRKFGEEEIIQVECSALWWNEKYNGNIMLDIRAYKGGTVYQQGRKFINSGGEEKGLFRYPDNVWKKLYSQNKKVTGQYIGTVTFNKEINYLSLDKY
jgi:hypothetical protein